MKCVLILMFAVASVRSECSTNAECPRYFFCGQKRENVFECVTHYTDLFHADNLNNCGVNDSNGNVVPDHSVCEQYHRNSLKDLVQDTDQLPSEYRCFPELGYKCTYVFFMPCRGDEECGPDFVCVVQNFRDGDAKVCVIPTGADGPVA